MKFSPGCILMVAASNFGCALSHNDFRQLEEDGTYKPTDETRNGKSGKTAKKNKKSKNTKKPKSIKGSKNNKKSKGYEEASTLPKIKSDGEPIWVQTGQVMTQWLETSTSSSRKTFTSKSSKGSRKIENNDQYMIQCNHKDYLADELCVFTCIDGILDETTYCQKKPKDVCKKARELTYIDQCGLDFDSDAPWHDGKSLKDWWKEVIDKYYFKGQEYFDRSSGKDDMYLGHGAAFLRGYGISVQNFEHMPQADKSFDADAIGITGWVSDGYEYGPDIVTNTTQFPNSNVEFPFIEFSQNGPFFLPRVTGPANFPNPRLKTMSLLKDNYDPCDDTPYLGFGPECFLYHPAGYHVGNGQMLNWLSPLSNGEIDMQGVCTTFETIPPTIVPALMLNMENVANYIEQTGGLIAAHPVSATMHLCLNDDDIYHPRLCPWHTDDPDIDAMPEPFDVDVRPFMPMPIELRKTLCKKREAEPGICDGPFDNITYPYQWTQFL